MLREHVVIKITDNDNVGIVPNPGGLPEGSVLEDGTLISRHIPMGQKVALQDIAEGEAIIRYGQSIGATVRKVKQGDWVMNSNISLPDPPDLQDISIPGARNTEVESLEGYTFQGYRNRDGSVGTKNVLGISSSVQCVAGLTQFAAAKIKKELLPAYPNVDDVVALNHTYGCGVAINSPAAIIPIRTLRNIAANPNFGGEILVVGLGCEKLIPERLIPQRSISPESGEHVQFSNILLMQDELFLGFKDMVEGVMELAKSHLERLNERRRETCPASDLIVGMQCGGSDVFSGITANPAAGFAADLIVRAGGSVIFSEVTEVRDAVHLLVSRTINSEVGEKLLEEIKWFDNYLLQGHADRSANTSPGNKQGGLSNIVEKALGSVAKSGTTPIVDVLGPGEKIRMKGLTFVATPSSDFVCGTLQLAAGMNIHVFMTGRGSPYGLSMCPVIKVSSNSKLRKRWYDIIDLDAGPIADGEKTIEKVGWELFHLILDVASGKEKVASDKLGIYNDLVLFDPGPLT